MKGEKLKSLLVALILALTLYTPALAARQLPDEEPVASLSLGVEFASGHYGTDSTVRSLYLPLIATWFPNDHLDISIEIPFIYQNSSNVTTELYRSGQNQMMVTRDTTTASAGPGGKRMTGPPPQTGDSSHADSSESDVSGLGDIILRSGAIAFFEDTNTPQIRPSLFVKCPTANSDNGLGTGQFDAGVGVDASKWFGHLNVNGEAFYTWQGKAKGFGLKNYLSFTTGVGYQLTENVRPILILKGATAPSTSSGELLEARARVLWSLNGTTALDLFVSRGITESSPDYGGGLAVSYSF